MRKQPVIVMAVLTVVLFSSWVSAQGEPRIRNGQAIYEEHCFRCHGLTGKGDGPDANALLVPPANFQTMRSRAKTDFELLTIIAYGVAFSPMHGWRGRLTDDEILEVINYIRTIAPFNPAL
ncbi:MAG: cytochrome c [Nitrospirae bacterium]|nr:cytochrome c [Nitrospirota bacterium]